MIPVFLITIDTEGDNLWARAASIATRNTAFLPRFQALCERFGFKPTWLTNYEMVMDPAFVSFGRDVIAHGTGEIGMHLHAWNSPPLEPLTSDDFQHHPYLLEFSDTAMREKIAFMTALLEDRFGTKMLSHRAGRWAFDERYAGMLIDFGYIADCSVTPGVSWRSNLGAPEGRGGSDYRRFPATPYFLDPSDISRAGNSGLLEIPMTTRRSRLSSLAPAAYRLPLVRSAASRVAPEVIWLRPNGRNLKQMMALVEQVQREKSLHLEFMLHSSELMPGGSPTFTSDRDVEKLYDDLEQLFELISQYWTGSTVSEFARQFARGGL